MTRSALAARSARAVLSSQSIHLPYHASENPTPPTMFRAARRVASRRPRRQFAPRRAAQHVRLVVFDHVPDDRRQPTHHRHPGDLRAPPLLDPPIPGLHLRVASQHVQHHLAEDEPRHRAALLGDRAEPVGRVARVAAAGRQAPIVGQAPRPRKPLDRADPRGQRQAAVGPAPGIVATTAPSGSRAAASRSPTPASPTARPTTPTGPTAGPSPADRSAQAPSSPAIAASSSCRVPWSALLLEVVFRSRCLIWLIVRVRNWPSRLRRTVSCRSSASLPVGGCTRRTLAPSCRPAAGAG